MMTDVVPEHFPPPGMHDPFVWRLGIDRFKWSREIRGQLPRLADYAIARALGDYGNKDGTRCRPGTERLAADLRCTGKSVQRSLDWLAEHGWIHLENRGIRRRGEANEYRLTIPAPIAAAKGWWTAEHGPQWIERPQGEPKRPGAKEGGHRRPPNARMEGGHRRPPNDGLGGHFDELGRHGCPEKVDTGVHPPGSTHQGFSHHSERLRSRPHADARGATNSSDLDPDDPDLFEVIQERLEEELRRAPRADTSSLILSMVERGAHPRMIVNAALANERQPA